MVKKLNKYYSYFNIRVGSDSGGCPEFHKIYFKHFKDKSYEKKRKNN